MPAEVEIARAEAERLLEEARAEAARLREQAVEEGYREGYEQGLAKGREQGEQTLAEVIAHVRQIADSAVEAKAQLLANLEPEVVDLVLAVTRKILGDEIATNRDAILGVVRGAMAQISESGPFRLRLHPADAKRLAAAWGTDGNEKEGRWELVPDERIDRAGCIIEIGAGTIDARPETQLARVREAFESLSTGRTDSYE